LLSNRNAPVVQLVGDLRLATGFNCRGKFTGEIAFENKWDVVAKRNLEVARDLLRHAERSRPVCDVSVEIEPDDSTVLIDGRSA